MFSITHSFKVNPQREGQWKALIYVFSELIVPACEHLRDAKCMQHALEKPPLAAQQKRVVGNLIHHCRWWCLNTQISLRRLAQNKISFSRLAYIWSEKWFYTFSLLDQVNLILKATEFRVPLLVPTSFTKFMKNEFGFVFVTNNFHQFRWHCTWHSTIDKCGSLHKPHIFTALAFYVIRRQIKLKRHHHSSTTRKDVNFTSSPMNFSEKEVVNMNATKLRRVKLVKLQIS